MALCSNPACLLLCLTHVQADWKRLVDTVDFCPLQGGRKCSHLPLALDGGQCRATPPSPGFQALDGAGQGVARVVLGLLFVGGADPGGLGQCAAGVSWRCWRPVPSRGSGAFRRRSLGALRVGGPPWEAAVPGGSGTPVGSWCCCPSLGAAGAEPSSVIIQRLILKIHFSKKKLDVQCGQNT